MQLPSNEVGISDILNYRECAQRFAFGMRRHVELPERFALFPGEKDEPPEHEGYYSAYGHASHEAIEVLEQTQCSPAEAVEAIWSRYQHFLEPEDVARLEIDCEVHLDRAVTGFRLIGTEVEIRVPLFIHEGVQIYFRGRVDELYQHIQNPGYWMSRDTKTARWPKKEGEVHKDPQQWSYNWGLHEFFPEIETLVQIYDQLRFGAIPTRKSPEQRQQIKRWLILQVKAMLADGVLKPTKNDMCHWCPLMMDCRVTHLSADYWVNRLAAMAPEKKDGRKIIVQLVKEHDGFDIYTDILPHVKNAQKVMERFIETVEGDLKAMPSERRAEFGYDLARPRNLDSWDTEAKRQLVDELGTETFIQLVRLTKKEIEEFFGADSDETKRIFAMASKKQTAPSLKRRKAA